MKIASLADTKRLLSELLRNSRDSFGVKVAVLMTKNITASTAVVPPRKETEFDVALLTCLTHRVRHPPPLCGHDRVRRHPPYAAAS